VSAAIGARARIVLWHAEGRLTRDVATLAAMSRPTVELWLGRYAADGPTDQQAETHAPFLTWEQIWEQNTC